MRSGIFILSVAVFIGATCFLVDDLITKCELNHFVYLMLLVIILINSVAGMFITWPPTLTKRK